MKHDHVMATMAQLPERLLDRFGIDEAAPLLLSMLYMALMSREVFAPADAAWRCGEVVVLVVL